MSVKFKHDNSYSTYYCTFTCFDWLPLIDVTNSYDIVYNWFNHLKSKEVLVVAYVIMPNHLHCILHFPSQDFNLNKLIGNGKRFMAYEIIKRLHIKGEMELILSLSNAVTLRERKKGQLHKVFKSSFDAKPIFSDKFLVQKINYIHHNPVRGKWNLTKDSVSYEFSSASFYELGISQHFFPTHHKDL